MKKIFYTLSLIALTFGLNAQMLNENFNYTVGNLNGQGGWVALATPAAGVNVIAGNLAYTGYDPSSLGIGNSVQLVSGGSRDDVAKPFVATTINAGSVYASFILTVNSIATSNPVSYPFCFMQATGSNNVCRLIVTSPSAGNVQFGIQRNSGTGATQSMSPTIYPFTASVTTFMIVVKYDFSNSTASLLVNPTLGGVEPTADATNATGSTFTDIQRVQLRQGESTGNYDVTIDGLRVGTAWTNGTVPVSWKSFTATKETDANILRWSTASETNNSHFEIQRSIDGKNFEAFAKVKGAGNSSKAVSYSYNDVKAPAAKTTYYRLKQVDFDGKFEYSKTVSIVTVEKKSGLGASLPNPFNTELNVSINAASASVATVELMDMIGKTHYTSTEQLVEGANKVSIETNDMPNGIYFIRVTANGETFTQKVIKK